MKCKVCETEFKPVIVKKYIAKDTNFLTGTKTLWDCFDCPTCGCQVIGNKRLEVVESISVEALLEQIGVNEHDERQ